MKNYLVEAIRNLKPNSEFHLTDEDYSTIVWDVLEGDAPTAAQIKSEIDKVKASEKTALKAKADEKAALLERLGITAEEAALLLG